MTSPAARLAGFLALLAVLLAGAYAAGALAGPLTVTHAPPGRGGTMQMSTGLAPARPAGPAR